MKIAISLATVLLLLLPFSSWTQNVRISGTLIPSAEQLDTIAMARVRPGGARPIKPRIDLSRYMPSPGDQDTLGSCSAWATTYYLLTYNKWQENRWSLYENQQLQKNHVYSPNYIFNMLHEKSDCKIGIYAFAALEYIRDFGACELRYFPHIRNCADQPGNIARTNATKNKILSYNKMFDRYNERNMRINVDEVRSTLTDSTPVVLVLWFDSSFYNNTYGNRKVQSDHYIWDFYGPKAPKENFYHTILCVGYDDDLHAVKLLNSWGKNYWGNEGYGWVSYDVLQNVVWEAYTSENITASQIERMVPAAASIEVRKKEIDTIGVAYGKNDWIKAGYFREYDDIRIGCLDIDRRNQKVIIQISLNQGDNTAQIGSYELSPGDTASIEYKNIKIDLKINSVGKAGNNPFTPGVYYDIFVDMNSKNKLRALNKRKS